MNQQEATRKALQQGYFTAKIEVLRNLTEKDEDGDTRTFSDQVVATIPGRIVRGKDPLEVVQSERVVSVKNWEVRLDLGTVEKLQRDKGCFEIRDTDRLRDKKSRRVLQINGSDPLRTEENYLSVFCVQVG